MFSEKDQKRPTSQISTSNSSVNNNYAAVPQINAAREDILFCATHGKVYAIHKKDGSRLWRYSLTTSIFQGVISLYVTDDDRLIVGGSGKTYCINMYTGEQIWENNMKGCMYEEVAIISTHSRKKTAQPQTVEDTDGSLPPGYQRRERPQQKPIVFGCTFGKCLAMDSDTGEEIWRFNCPKGGLRLPVMILDTWSNSDQQRVFVGCGKWVYCLRADNGNVLWSTRVSNSYLGLGFITLATPWNARLEAEAFMSFGNPTVAT